MLCNDIVVKMDGSVCFVIDVRLFGMLYVVVVMCLIFGGKFKIFNVKVVFVMFGVWYVVLFDGLMGGVLGVVVVVDYYW